MINALISLLTRLASALEVLAAKEEAKAQAKIAKVRALYDEIAAHRDSTRFAGTVASALKDLTK